MAKSLLRESMDAAQIPRGIRLAPAGVTPEARSPLIAVVDDEFEIAAGEERLSEADAVVIRLSDPTALRLACAAVCRRARRGQTIVLASPGYLGATRQLLIDPLVEAGFELGRDICVACSPEAPGPRVLGAAGPACAERARAAIEPIAPRVELVSSPEAAELSVLLAEAAAAAGLAPPPSG